MRRTDPASGSGRGRAAAGYERAARAVFADGEASGDSRSEGAGFADIALRTIASDDVRTAAFANREDGAWQAVLTLHSQNRYAIYWVEEPGTKRNDTNGGAYFEVLFCDARGERPESTIGYRARTYDGWLESRGFDRPANFSKALEILEVTFIRRIVAGRCSFGGGISRICRGSRRRRLVSRCWRRCSGLCGSMRRISLDIPARLISRSLRIGFR